MQKALLVAAAVLGASLVQAQSSAYPGIGRTATPNELAAWDIDVRPDFKVLPKGQGSVAKGQDVWEAQCASCHGIFGESNQVFSPLVGGTTAQDLKSGHVARLNDAAFPGRTTLMKLPTLSTLWGYINRAMPWNAPKSLATDEVYAVTAFMLNLGGVVGNDFTLSDANMAEAQGRLPNRNGMSSDHGLWPGRGPGNSGKPDIKAAACLNNCVTEARVASFLPDFARNAHGNLAQQNRLVGAQHGADTTGAPGANGAALAVVLTVAAPPSDLSLAQKHNCLACHGLDNKVVGPALREVAKMYAEREDAAAHLAQRVQSGGAGIWGPIPMPAQSLPGADLKLIAQWLADGAKK